MIAALFRRIARWNHIAHVHDLDWQLRVHRAHLAALPAEIRRVNELRRFHQGRASTLASPRLLVNYHLGTTRKP